MSEIKIYCSSVPFDVTQGFAYSSARTEVGGTTVRPVRLLARTKGDTKIVVGPPGCGKTTVATGECGAALARGVPPHRIAFVTFTRAATKEARRRLLRDYGVPPSALPFVRTIHSLAFQLLGWSSARLMDVAAWRRFGKAHGYVFTQTTDAASVDEPFCLPVETDGDRLRFILSHGRNRRRTLEEMIDRRPLSSVVPAAIRLFAKRLNAFKAESGLHEYADMLEAALASDRLPDVDVAFVDEAQDLSPLQIALVEKWFASCPSVWIVGDDDQAVYGFNGADPNWLGELARVHGATVLSQSYRVPFAAHALAIRVIDRNEKRVPKAYAPTAEVGEVLNLDLDSALRRVDGAVSAFVLARNRIFLRRCAETLRAARVPYVVEGGGAPSALADPEVAPAVRAAVRLAREGADGSFEPSELAALTRFVPSGGDVLARGVKAEIERTRGRVRASEVGLTRLAEIVASKGPLAAFERIPVVERAYLAAILGDGAELPTPNVVLTTIHGAKGREAETVVVIPDMTRRTWEAYRRDGAGREAENRVFYVAATRTKRTLILSRPTTKRAYAFPTVRGERGAI